MTKPFGLGGNITRGRGARRWRLVGVWWDITGGAFNLALTWVITAPNRPPRYVMHLTGVHLMIGITYRGGRFGAVTTQVSARLGPPP